MKRIFLTLISLTFIISSGFVTRPGAEKAIIDHFNNKAPFEKIEIVNLVSQDTYFSTKEIVQGKKDFIQEYVDMNKDYLKSIEENEKRREELTKLIEANDDIISEWTKSMMIEETKIGTDKESIRITFIFIVKFTLKNGNSYDSKVKVESWIGQNKYYVK